MYIREDDLIKKIKCVEAFSKSPNLIQIWAFRKCLNRGGGAGDRGPSGPRARDTPSIHAKEGRGFR